MLEQVKNARDDEKARTLGAINVDCSSVQNRLNADPQLTLGQEDLPPDGGRDRYQEVFPSLFISTLAIF